jgi:glycosyltransferase involved in cell wall biosynthesis
MRVLLVSRAALVGTYQSKLEQLAAHRDIETLTVVVPPRWRERGRVQPLERDHVAGYDLVVEPVVANGSFHLHWYPRLPARIRSLRPDIVHVEEEPYNVATWHALRAARRHAAHTVCFTWQNIHRRLPRPFESIARGSLRRTDHLVCGNHDAVRVWRSRGFTGPVSVIPQVGIDPETFAPGPGPARDRHGPDRGAEPPSDTPITVGYAGRLVTAKGVDVLVRAAARARHAPRLAIVGAGPERANLVTLAERSGVGARTSVAAWVSSGDMAEWYRSIDVLVLPSRTTATWKEQFGRVLVEAMASGVPVVGSDSGEIPNVIGDAGVVVPEGDPDALARALDDLQSPSRRRWLARAGRARVLAHYTQARVAARTVETYAQVLADSSPR